MVSRKQAVCLLPSAKTTICLFSVIFLFIIFLPGVQGSVCNCTCEHFEVAYMTTLDLFLKSGCNFIGEKKASIWGSTCC